jgi:D-alanyl-lipoteichoic acid acyltransferase DltB (MBOAT superfamily)
MKKLKSFTGWSIVFLLATVSWLIFEQNTKLLNSETAAISFPIVVAVSIMAHYERRIRSLGHSNPPEIMVAGKGEKTHPS